MSVTEVERACAEKFDVPDPENYRLFVVRGESYQLLEGDTCPQKVKEELKQKGETSFHFVYGLEHRSKLAQTSSEEEQPISTNDPRKFEPAPDRTVKDQSGEKAGIWSQGHIQELTGTQSQNLAEDRRAHLSKELRSES
eukprot:g29638.t1